MPSAAGTPELPLYSGSLYVSAGNRRLLAGIVAVAVAWRFRTTYVTVAAGLAALNFFDWML